MKERMQKTLAFANDCPKEIGRNPNGYMAMIVAMNCFSMAMIVAMNCFSMGGSFMWMTEDNIVEVPFDREHLLEDQCIQRPKMGLL